MKHRTAREQASELSLVILSILVGGLLVYYNPSSQPAELVWACTWSYAICLGILVIFGDFGESSK